MTFLEKKKILQVLPALGAGGVEQGTLDIARALVGQGAEAWVAASGGHRAEELSSFGGRFLDLPLASKNPLRLFWRNIYALIKVIKTHQIDLVHARSRGPAWSAYWACRLTKTPFVTTFHGTYNFNSQGKKLYNSSMVRGDQVIAISNFIENHLLDHYKVWVRPEKVTRVYRGIDTQAYNQAAVSEERRAKIKEQWRLADSQKVFLMPGRLTRWKGQETAIKALARSANPKMMLVIVGSDQGRHAYRQELLALSRELGLKNQVRIVEHCEDMPAAYSLAHCVIHASTDPEAFGRVVAEGQSMGLPCLVSTLGAPREIIDPGETGWLVPAGRERALAEAMQKMMFLSADQRFVIAQKARERVKTSFSLEKMCAQTFSVYEKALKSFI